VLALVPATGANFRRRGATGNAHDLRRKRYVVILSCEMSRPTTLHHGAPSREAAVLTKAVVRAAQILGLSQRELGQILGLSPASVSRMHGGKLHLGPETKEGELALLLLRVFRSLDALVGGETESLRAWLRADNLHLAGVPLERMKTIQGLVDVAVYLDAMRGKT